MTRLNTWFAVGIAAVAFVGGLAVAQDDLNLKNLQELRREALTGTNMEVIISVIDSAWRTTRPSYSSWRGSILCASRRAT